MFQIGGEPRIRLDRRDQKTRMGEGVIVMSKEANWRGAKAKAAR